MFVRLVDKAFHGSSTPFIGTFVGSGCGARMYNHSSQYDIFLEGSEVVTEYLKTEAIDKPFGHPFGASALTKFHFTQNPL